MYHYEEYRILDEHHMAIAKASDKIYRALFYVFIASRKIYLQYKFYDFALKCFLRDANGFPMPE